jgi:protein SCO1/2
MNFKTQLIQTLSVKGVIALKMLVVLWGATFSSAVMSSGSEPTQAQPYTSADQNIWGRQYFPNYELTAHTGETLKFFDDVIAGKVVAVNFIFTSCRDICPVETARMRDVFNLLGDRVGDDVFFYSITIDPARDDVETLKTYAERFGIDGDRWKFLTGKKEEIDHIRHTFGLYSTPEEEADLSNHNINLMIGNQVTGKWAKRTPFENPQILADQLGGWLHEWRAPEYAQMGNYADAPLLRQISAGEMMFRDRCSSCHDINGGNKPARGGRSLGPDLFAVSERRDAAWLERWMLEPDTMLEEGDPIATAMYDVYGVTMPNFRLETSEVKNLLSYVSGETQRLRERAERIAQTEQASDAQTNAVLSSGGG